VGGHGPGEGEALCLIGREKKNENYAHPMGPVVLHTHQPAAAKQKKKKKKPALRKRRKMPAPAARHPPPPD
jgi:hypothetical protein